MLILAAMGVVVLSPLGAILIGGHEQTHPISDVAHAAKFTAACDAPAPAAAQEMTFKAPPPLRLNEDDDYWASVYTSCGDFKINLLERRAPLAVNNFVFLARRGFYDGLTWHQVSHDFLIQTGDPNGTNGELPDDAGYTIRDELPSGSNPYRYGVVGFANRGTPNTAGSQFFVTVHGLQGALEGNASALQIEPNYTVFGSVPKKFFGSLEHIARQPVAGGEDPLRSMQPVEPVFIEGIDIHVR